MAHGYNGYATEGTTLGVPSTGTKTTSRGILPASTPGFIGNQYPQYGNDVFPAGHTNRNLDPSNDTNATALGMGHGTGGYATGGVTLGAPSTGVTTNRSSTLASPTPGSVGDEHFRYRDLVEMARDANRDFDSWDSASATAYEMTHGSSGYVNYGNAFGDPVVGTTITMGNSLSASTLGSIAGHDPYYSAGAYGTRYPNVNPNLSNNALPMDIRTAYGSSSNVSNGTAFGVPSTSAATTMSGTMLGSTFGPVGNPYLQHSDGAYPTGYSAANPNLSINTGTAPGSNAHATNDIATMAAHRSNRNAANDTVPGGAAQSPGIPLTLGSTFSPSVPSRLAGPDGGTRWACTTCSKTFAHGRSAVHHAKEKGHGFNGQCSAPGCTYKGSYRQVAMHKLHTGH